MEYQKHPQSSLEQGKGIAGTDTVLDILTSPFMCETEEVQLQENTRQKSSLSADDSTTDLETPEGSGANY